MRPRSKFGYGMFFDFVAIVFSEFSDMLVDNVVTCNRVRTFVYGFIILSENVVRWQIMNALVTFEFLVKQSVRAITSRIYSILPSNIRGSGKSAPSGKSDIASFPA